MAKVFVNSRKIKFERHEWLQKRPFRSKYPKNNQQRVALTLWKLRLSTEEASKILKSFFEETGEGWEPAPNPRSKQVDLQDEPGMGRRSVSPRLSKQAIPSPFILQQIREGRTQLSVDRMADMANAFYELIAKEMEFTPFPENGGGNIDEWLDQAIARLKLLVGQIDSQTERVKLICLFSFLVFSAE